MTKPNQRVFDVSVEGIQLQDIDLVKLGPIKTPLMWNVEGVIVTDGVLNIDFSVKEPRINNPKINAIEVRLFAPHLAHAVAGADGYSAVDTDNSGSAVVTVDGGQSHTHAPGQVVTSWIWKEGTKVLGTGVVADLDLTVGVHQITLYIRDSNGNEAEDTTTVTVFPSEYPSILSLSVNSGGTAGGTEVIITGSGFASATTVQFGVVQLIGGGFTILSNTAIRVVSPASAVAVPVPISVKTTVGESTPVLFTYVGSVQIGFASGKIADVQQPTSIAFGPDGKLYCGTSAGTIVKMTMNQDHSAVVTTDLISIVDPNRPIMGLAFDPLDVGPNPTVYCSSSNMFHGSRTNENKGNAVNGKIYSVSGSNLDVVAEVVSGLPVSDHE
jgi:IPT/TIG domain/Malectin domain